MCFDIYISVKINGTLFNNIEYFKNFDTIKSMCLMLLSKSMTFKVFDMSQFHLSNKYDI